MTQEEYEKDLKARQEAHLKSLENKPDWKPCLHDQCPNCLGTGRSKFGLCTHMVSCDCPKCSLKSQASTKLNYPPGVRCLTVNPPIYEKYNINPDFSGTNRHLYNASSGSAAMGTTCPETKLEVKSAYNSGLTLTNGSNAYCISVNDSGQLGMFKINKTN